jgi:hypothetical protein
LFDQPRGVSPSVQVFLHKANALQGRATSREAIAQHAASIRELYRLAAKHAEHVCSAYAGRPKSRQRLANSLCKTNRNLHASRTPNELSQSFAATRAAKRRLPRDLRKSGQRARPVLRNFFNREAEPINFAICIITIDRLLMDVSAY